MTEQRLSEATEQLTASRERCDELRAKLSRAKDNLRLAQLNAEEFKDKFVRVSDDMVRLRERFTQVRYPDKQVTCIHISFFSWTVYLSFRAACL